MTIHITTYFSTVIYELTLHIATDTDPLYFFCQLPEVNHAGEEESLVSGTMWKVFLLQNAGLLTGFGIMLFLAVYAEKIDFESK